MDIGYARVSTTHQDLTRQIDALVKFGIPEERIYVDKRTGANTDREGWKAALAYARPGDRVVSYTLDRMGRSVLSVLEAVRDLKERGVGIKTLADPVPVDTSEDGGPMAELALILLSLFGQWELTYGRERAAHARRVAAETGKQVGRPRRLTDEQIRYATHLRDVEGRSVSTIARDLGVGVATLYRGLPPRPVLAPTASGTEPEQR
ncbi:recombinase family protein [Cellulomonas sp. DKR-3]|uniref:Recombinase family protein n=1 Tax=Cellulomonas fulva TaxID=2835530 RepID=A0ABS5U261_9CELL|nr:recombinase family protein [Cellulomonas fulva]MBT0995465.1 recombinase family protein [Cellulomonas fulva]